MSGPPALYLFSAQGGEFSLYAAPVPSAGASARSGAADTPRSSTLPRPRAAGPAAGGAGVAGHPPFPPSAASPRRGPGFRNGTWRGWGVGTRRGGGRRSRSPVGPVDVMVAAGWMDVGSRGRLCPSRIFLRSGLAVHNYLPGKPLPQKAFAEGAFAEGAAAAIAEPWTYLDSVGFYY